MKRSLLLIIAIIVCSVSFGQVGHQFAFGMSYGYRLNSGCFFVDYNFSGKAVVTGEFSIDKYMAGGIGIGAAFYPFNENAKFRPLLGATYTRTVGGSSGYGEEENSTVINVHDADYFTMWTGIRCNGFDKDPTNGKFLSAVLKVGYKIATPLYPKVELVSGPPLPEKVNKINNYIENGIVVSIGVVLNLPRRKKQQ